LVGVRVVVREEAAIRMCAALTFMFYLQSFREWQVTGEI
jgi:hypothetical protein